MTLAQEIRSGERSVRSLLFAPATHTRRLERLDDFGADAVVIDLEDAVADAEKVEARKFIAPALATYEHAMRCVRVNGLDTGLFHDDVDAVVGPDVDAIVVPKVESTHDLRIVDRWFTKVEERHGLEPGRIALMPIVETARGFAQLDGFMHAPVERFPLLVFGSGDFTSELGIEVSEGVGQHAPELLFARGRMVVASRAAGLAAPVDGPYLNIHDSDGLLADTRRSRREGFQGRVVVYPKQVEFVHDGYSGLTPEERQRASRIVEAFESAESDGSASIQVDGLFVDYPIYRRAVEVLAQDEHQRTRNT